MGFLYNGRLSKAFTPKENQELSNAHHETELQIRCVMANEQGKYDMRLRVVKN